MKYYRLSENNEWEGETWHFYIPVEGNEEEMVKLKEKYIDGEIYCVSIKKFTEERVDILCEDDNNTSYMNKHNKLKGKLTVPENLSPKTDDPLYKGGICKFMKE